MQYTTRRCGCGGTSASGANTGLRLKFNNATVDIVLLDYSEHTKRTLLLAPDVPKATITLQSQGDLTLDEYLQAVETVLSMNGVALLREGDKFLRVVKNDKAFFVPGARVRVRVPVSGKYPAVLGSDFMYRDGASFLSGWKPR